MKMLKHCEEARGEAVMGQLLGIDVNGTTEITNCFAMPSGTEDQSEEDDLQNEMTRLLRDVNVDNYNAGLYISSVMNDFYGPNLIQAMNKYQTENANRVFIIIDPAKSRQGRLALRAMRLTPAFLALYASGKLSAKSFAAHHVDSLSIFEDVPVRVRNSHLAHAFLYDLREARAADCAGERLSLGSVDAIERMLTVVTAQDGALTEHVNEQMQLHFAQRKLAAQVAELARQVDQTLDDNRRLKALGREPKPVPDLAALKAQEPSRLESFLATAKVDALCQDLASLASQTLLKEAALRAFVRVDSSSASGAAAGSAAAGPEAGTSE